MKDKQNKGATPSKTLTGEAAKEAIRNTMFLKEEDVVYVVVSNTTVPNKETGKDDEYTHIRWVFKTDEEARRSVLDKEKTETTPNTQFFIIPTPFGNVNLRKGHGGQA